MTHEFEKNKAVSTFISDSETLQVVCVMLKLEASSTAALHCEWTYQ